MTFSKNTKKNCLIKFSKGNTQENSIKIDLVMSTKKWLFLKNTLLELLN